MSSNEGLVLVCTSEGIIQAIRHDSASWMKAEMGSLLDIVHADSLTKAREYLSVTWREGVALSWEIYLSDDNRTEAWVFHGVRTPAGVLVIAVLSLDHAKKQQQEVFSSTANITRRNDEFHENVNQRAITDPLTGLFNRWGWSEFGQREVARSRRFTHPLSVLMIDIDHFKRVNDTYGHAVGDKILSNLARLIKNNLREIDIIGRYGGEEFIVFLPETALGEAVVVGRKLRQLVEVAPLLTGPQPISITISIGVANLEADTTLEEFINQADKALYRAKESGRNRVRSWAGLCT